MTLSQSAAAVSEVGERDKGSNYLQRDPNSLMNYERDVSNVHVRGICYAMLTMLCYAMLLLLLSIAIGTAIVTNIATLR